MTNKILIDYKSYNKSCVISDDKDVIKECIFLNEDKQSVKSNIYLATVLRIEASLEAAFVDYGGGKAGFLPFGEIHPSYYNLPQEDKEKVEKELKLIREGRKEDIEKEEEVSVDLDEDSEITTYKDLYKSLYKKYNIQQVIKKGQAFLVQIFKDERGNKGASVTTYISIPGRCCVYMPNSAGGIAISKKIYQSEKRKRISSLLKNFNVPQEASLIVRTIASEFSNDDFKKDFNYLKDVWEEIKIKTVNATPPAKIYEEIDIIKQTIRDYYDSKKVSTIIVNDNIYYKDLSKFVARLIPGEEKKIRLHKEDEVRMLQKYGLDKKIYSLLIRTVHLKSGGYIVIDHTEALTSIDINSGKAILEKDIEETALKINIEAAEEISRQIKLRGIGGLVVVDFIDMEELQNRKKLEEFTKDLFLEHRAKIHSLKLSNFGLMEISVQRLRNSLSEVLESNCNHCEGTGKLKIESVLANGIVSELEDIIEDAKRNKKISLNQISIKVSENIVDFICNKMKKRIKDLEVKNRIDILFEPFEPISYDFYKINLNDKNGNSIDFTEDRFFIKKQKQKNLNLVQKIIKKLFKI